MYLGSDDSVSESVRGILISGDADTAWTRHGFKSNGRSEQGRSPNANFEYPQASSSP